eukprot:Phypoly_transcript_11186.p1 GENE.Phypoly_transcript_11186~~Phypoly_transcript_11186.p1  ORF type:complete len:301 (-),score=6.85 Phypoly_transcript_11186:256-1158(-)
MGFTYSENTTIILTTYTTSTLGLIGSLFTVLTFLTFKEARNVATSLIFSLALSDMCSSVATSYMWAWTDHNEWFSCNLQASLLMFGLCASILWGLMIGCYMYLALYKNVDIELIDKYSYIFHIFVWGYSFTAAILPIFFKQYGVMFPGNSLTWCWIKDPSSSFRMISYIPDFIVFVLLIFLYGMIQFRLRNTQSSLADTICRKMCIYLLVYAVINLFAIINRVQNYVMGADAVFELYFLQFLTQPLQGLLNAIAYAWNEPEFVEHYKRLFMKFRTQHVPSQQIQDEQKHLMSMVCYDDNP